MKSFLTIILGASLAFVPLQLAHARGYGGCRSGGGGYHGGGEAGGYHGGGESGGYHGGGSASGYHASGAEASGYHASGAEASGYHAGGAEASGYHAGGAEASGYHAGAYGGAEAGHAGLPTDAGFGGAAAHPAAAGYAVGNHSTEAVNSNVLAARGAAVRNSYNGAGAFGQGWYGDHPGAWAAAGWSSGQAWQAASWAGVGTTLGWAEAAAIPYDYGSNITYQDNQVYNGDQPVATADQYYQQAQTIAQSAPAPDPSANDWMPLGVYALVRKAEDQPHFIMQVAVNKAGAIGGNYCDLMTDTVHALHGSVDKTTQRVCWTIGDNKKTVGEAGLYNMTQDQAPALIHTGKDKTQQWLLVRLKQPQDQPASDK